MKCKLFDIEMPIGHICPSRFNLDRDLCYEGCGFAEGNFPEESELIE